MLSDDILKISQKMCFRWTFWKSRKNYAFGRHFENLANIVLSVDILKISQKWCFRMTFWKSRKNDAVGRHSENPAKNVLSVGIFKISRKVLFRLTFSISRKNCALRSLRPEAGEPEGREQGMVIQNQPRTPRTPPGEPEDPGNFRLHYSNSLARRS